MPIQLFDSFSNLKDVMGSYVQDSTDTADKLNQIRQANDTKRAVGMHIQKLSALRDTFSKKYEDVDNAYNTKIGALTAHRDTLLENKPEAPDNNFVSQLGALNATISSTNSEYATQLNGMNREETSAMQSEAAQMAQLDPNIVKTLSETGIFKPHDIKIPATTSVSVKQTSPVDYENKGMTDKGWTLGYDKTKNSMLASKDGKMEPYNEKIHGKLVKAGEAPATALPQINYNLKGDKFLDDLRKKDPALADFVKMVGDNAVPISEAPTRNFRGGAGLTEQQISPLVKRYKDTWDETQFPAMKNYKKRFESGDIKTRIGNINTALNHLDDVREAGEDMDKMLTNRGGIFTKSYNTIGAWAADNAGSPEVIAFNTAATRVADELASFYKGGTGSATDIGQESERILNSIKNAPAQKGAFVGMTAKLLAGAVASIREGYVSAMGGEPDPNKIIQPTGRKALKNLEKAGVPIDWDSIDPTRGLQQTEKNQGSQNQSTQRPSLDDIFNKK